LKNYSDNKSIEFVNSIVDDISKILPYIKVTSNTLLASNRLSKSSLPIVRIDSKEPIKALMLKFTENSVTIKSIVNSTGEKGFSKKVIDIILKNIDRQHSIVIDQDVSGGFWDSVIQKNPDYNWVMI
jgi:hypothetical protein